jgi:hypothetical protein
MVKELRLPHLKKTLTTNEMTSSQWHGINYMEYIVKKYIQIYCGKIFL